MQDAFCALGALGALGSAAWQAYLIQAAGSTRYLRQDGPLVWSAGEGSTVQINPGFSYCRDCRRQHEASMRRVGRCDPLFIEWLTKGEVCRRWIRRS